MIIMWLLLLCFIFFVYKVISIYPPRSKNEWSCGYFDFRGPVNEVIHHAHSCHQYLLSLEDLDD
jgi:hypothetical protein